VSGAVTFDVVDTAGNYEERLAFGYINGTSSSNKVIFRNHSVNSGKATGNLEPSGSTDVSITVPTGV